MKPSEYIKKHGWCKDIIQDNQGRVCLYGALCKCYKNLDKRSEIEERILKEIKRRLKTNYTPLEDYNDAPSRRKGDVIKLLEKLGL